MIFGILAPNTRILAEAAAADQLTVTAANKIPQSRTKNGWDFNQVGRNF